MRRAPALIAGALSLVLLTALVWAMSDRDDLRAELAAKDERLEEVYDELAGTRAAHRTVLHELDDSMAEAKRFRRRASAFADEASGARRALRRLRGVAVLALGKDVYRARLVRGDTSDLLVVGWSDRDGRGAGVYVWRVDGRSVELVYVVEPRVSLRDEDDGYVLVGPPGALVEDGYDAWIEGAGVADVGDATGDGLSDLALQEHGLGTGGCGKVRLLQNLDGTVRQTFESFDCDHSLSIEGGRLLYATATHPKGCDSIHGCGTKRTWMRWDGSSWVVEKVTRKRY
ncbi:MAG: hypothetical protein M3134_08515 [Actinomycetota bacterium]|nr:hypothetical protein [Actinomycetota bacterium]